MAQALVYALWSEDRHDEGHPQLRGLFASVALAQADVEANRLLPLSPWRPAVGYLDNEQHGGEMPLLAEVLYDTQQHPLAWATYTIEPTTVVGLELFTGEVAR